MKNLEKTLTDNEVKDMMRLHKHPELIQPLMVQYGVDEGELNQMYDTYLVLSQKTTERYIRR